MTSLGCCCWPGERVSQSPDCWSSCNVQGGMRKGGVGDDKRDAEGVRTLGGREM